MTKDLQMPLSMQLDDCQFNADRLVLVRPQANMEIGVVPVRKKPHPYEPDDAREYVCMSISNNNVSQDILIPKEAWNKLRKCICKFDSVDE